MHAFKAFSCSLSEARERALPPTHTSCLAKASRHVQTTQEMPLVCMALVAKGVSTARLQGTITIGKTLLARALHRRQKHTPSLPVKKTDLLTLQSEGQASGFSDFQGIEAGRHHPWAPHWPHYSSAKHLRKDLIPLSRALMF